MILVLPCPLRGRAIWLRLFRERIGEVVSGDEKVEFDGAGGGISSLYSG
jgi:hypothetical protein